MPAPRRLVAAVLVLAGGLAVACTDPEPLTGPAASFTSAYCVRLERCRPRLLRDEFGDVASCSKRFLPSFNDELQANGTTITTAQTDACAAKLDTTPCSVLTSTIAECNFVGTLAAGAPCGSGYQCQTGSCFRATNASGVTAICGTCSARVAAGGDCTTANCENGLSCVQGRCLAPAAEGAACNADSQPCATPLQCFGGTCVRPLAGGAPCTPVESDKPDPHLCDSLHFCAPSKDDPKVGTCTAVRHAPLGDSCGIDERAGELIACSGGGCTSRSGGRCVADLAEGAACDPTLGGCQVPLECLEGRCAQPLIAGCR